MASNWQEFVTKVSLNTSEAEDKLKKLTEEQKRLNAEMNKLTSSGASKKEVNNLQKQINQNEKAMRNLQKQATNVIDVIDNMDSSSLEQLLQVQRMLNAEMKKTPQNTEYFTQLSERLQRVNTAIAGIREQTKQNYSEMKGLADETANLNNVLKSLDESSLKELGMAESTLKRQMQEAKPNSDEYKKAAANLKLVQTRISDLNRAQREVNTAIDKYNQELQNCGKSAEKVQQETKLINQTLSNLGTAKIREMEYTVQVLNERLRDTDRGTETYKRLEEQLKKVKVQLAAVAAEQQVGNKESIWSKFANSMNKNMVAVTSVMASITGLTMTVRNCVEAFTQMDQEMNNVRKYTGQTMQQVEDMNEDFKKMDTRTSREELNQLAGAAGRLGITSKEMIEEFVDAADKINVALGDDLGQGAVDKIGKLAQVFGEDKKKGLRGAMLATGSAVNELAQSSSANAGYIVDFTADLAGVARQANMSQAEIMGLGSALDQNMQEEATASTVFSQLITKMYQDPAKFAKLAGVDVKKFTTMLKTDANEALLTFMQTMQNKGGFSALAPMFQQMNLDGTRAVGVLSSVATHLDQVKVAQETAKKAYEAGTSVIGEFNVQNETEAAKIDKAKKAFKEITIELGEKLLPIARYGITTTSLAVKTLSVLVDVGLKYRTTLVALTAGIAALVIAEEADIIKKKLIAFWNNVVVAGCKRLWAVLEAHPYVAVAAAVGLLVAWLIDLSRRTNDQVKIQKELNDIKKTAAERTIEETERIKQLEKAMNNGNLSMADRKKAAEQLNSIIPGYNAKLDATRQRYVANKQKLDDYIKSLMHMYEVMGAKDKLKELGKQRADAKLALENAKKAQKEAEELNKRIAQTNSKGLRLAPSQAETSFLNQNISSAENRVKEAQKKVDEIDKKSKAIESLYGTDIQKSEINKPEPNPDAVTNNNGGGTGLTDKERKKLEAERKKREAARKAQMKKEIEEEKNKTAQEQADNTVAYATGQKLYKDYLDDKHDIAVKGYEAIKKVYQKYGEDASQYDEKISEEDLKKMQDRQKATLKEIEKEKAQQEAMTNSDYYNPSSEIYMNEEALQERLFQIDVNAQQKKINALQAGSEEWIDARDEMEQMQRDHQLELQQNYQQKLGHLREQFGQKDVKMEEEIALKGLDELHKKGLIKEEEYQEMLKNIKLYYAEQESEKNLYNSKGEVFKRNADSAYKRASNNAKADYQNDHPNGVGMMDYITSDVSIYSTTLENIKKMEQDGVVTHEEAMAAMGQATADMCHGIAEKMQAAYDAVSPIMDAMSSYYSAQCDLEVTQTEKKYEKLIEKAGNNSAKSKKLEEKKEKEIAKIKTKYNRKQVKIQIAQAIAQTAVAAINAYASAAAIPVVGHVLAPIAAGIATAAGMIQVATIKKQAQAQEAGYYEGGFTGGNKYRREAGVVHEGEFVANHQAVNNPNILPMLQLIDNAQRNNTIGGLTANDVTRQLGQGGTAVVAPVVNVNTDNSDMAATMEGVAETMEKLNNTIKDGIPANVYLDGNDGLMHRIKQYNRLEANK